MNTLVRTPRTRMPEFFATPISPDQSTTYDTVDINTVDPRYRSIYQSYNDTITNLANMDRMARERGEAQRQELKAAYEGGAGRAENRFINQQDVIRQSAQDAQLMNKIRARAMGGGASSGVLELANRVDRDANKNVAMAAGEYTGALSDLELKGLQGINSIRDSLNQTIASIIQNKSLTLRERDAAIAKAEEDARTAAREAAYYNSLYGGDSMDTMAGTGNVLGNQTSLEVETIDENTNQFDRNNPVEIYGRMKALRDIINQSQFEGERQAALRTYQEMVKLFGTEQYNQNRIYNPTKTFAQPNTKYATAGAGGSVGGF